MKSPRATDRSRRRPVTPVEPVTRHLGYLLRQAQLGVSDDFNERVGPYDLRQGEFSVLNMLLGQPKTRQAWLGQELGIKPGNLSLMLDGLERRKLISRDRDQHDARIVIVSLAPDGRKLIGHANRAVERHSASMRTMLGNEGHDTLVELLARFVVKLGRGGTNGQE